MGKEMAEITAEHKSFIEDQHLFFVTTAPLSEKVISIFLQKDLIAFGSFRQPGSVTLILSEAEMKHPPIF
jgi:hypothetical protein